MAIDSVNIETAISGGNWSADTWTGTLEINDSPYVAVSLQTDEAGTLYFDFSVDGTNVSTFPPAGFTITAGVHEYHGAHKAGRYFRPRFVGTGGRSYFRLYTFFTAVPVTLNAPLGQDVSSDSDAAIVKAILSSTGGTTVNVTDHRAMKVSPPGEGQTSFGEALTAQLAQKFAASFHIFNNPLILETQENQSGTVTNGNEMAVISSGAAANSSAKLASSRFIHYQPGMGIRARFTALFTTGVTGNTQKAGLLTVEDGITFGYNGTEFGIMHSHRGLPEVRTLTITTKSSTAENATVTLNGNAASIAVTNGADTTVTANEIAAGDYSDVGRGWTAKAAGSKVIFTSWGDGARSGSYSVAGTTIAGTFAQTVAGADTADTWYEQSTWNGEDIFDGNGLTGVTLDPTKGNVYQIDYQYLGFGGIAFYVEDPDDRELHIVHIIEYANANIRPSLSNPAMKLAIASENTSNTSDVSVKTASMAAFVDGAEVLFGARFTERATYTNAGTTEIPFLTIRNKVTFQSKPNHSEIKLLRISASADHTKPVEVLVYENATLTGASFSSVNASSIAEKDTSATAITGGRLRHVIPLGKSGQAFIDLSQNFLENILTPGSQYTFVSKPSSGTNAETAVSVSWVELV